MNRNAPVLLHTSARGTPRLVTEDGSVLVPAHLEHALRQVISARREQVRLGENAEPYLGFIADTARQMSC